MDQNAYRNLVSGSDSRTIMVILRFILRIISWFYALAVSVRNLLYDIGILKSHKVNCPVISIGNVTTGGTGKTPLVIWLCEYLQSKGIKCAVLTRGYRSAPDKLTDEPAILARSCSDAQVIVNPDRISGAQKALQSSQVKSLVMDDGFQHRRLHRNLDIIAVDATCPFGYGKLLPAGLLRESLNSLKRARAVIITRYEQAEPTAVDNIVNRIKGINPDIIISKAATRHPYAETSNGDKFPIDQLKQRKIFAFCGIGNPSAYLSNLQNLELQVVGSRIFDDHHDYTPQDMADIYQQAQNCSADLILCTEKDWVKTSLLVGQNNDILSAYLALKIAFVAGEDELKKLIDLTVIAEKDDK